MANFLEYNPEQGYLLPPTVREVLGDGQLCFFGHGAVEKLDLQELEASYSDEGHPAYHPALLLKVWLHAYALGMTSSRRREQRIREDLALRYLAGGAQPDFWALNEFRKRQGRAMNDIFTQVVEWARSLGLGPCKAPEYGRALFQKRLLLARDSALSLTRSSGTLAPLCGFSHYG
jgi:transposase